VPDAGNDVPVQWDDYSPELQGDIDSLQLSGDCQGLQDMFDVAEANDEATRFRRGHGNGNLMAYIFHAQQLAGCL
jgi:hypothetical protein